MTSRARGWWRAIAPASAVLTLLFSSTWIASDAYAVSEAERAAHEIQEARDRANAAAQLDKPAQGLTIVAYEDDWLPDPPRCVQRIAALAGRLKSPPL